MEERRYNRRIMNVVCVLCNIRFTQQCDYWAKCLQMYIPVLQLNEECHAGEHPTRPVGEMIQGNRGRYRILDAL